jgi:hypothetical protein
MIIDFATMLQNIRDSNAHLLNIIQQSGNIIDAQFDREVIPGTAKVIPGTATEKTNKDKDQEPPPLFEEPPPLFEDVAPLQYKKGEKEIILRDSTGNTIATMERIDVKPKS